MKNGKAPGPSVSYLNDCVTRFAEWYEWMRDLLRIIWNKEVIPKDSEESNGIHVVVQILPLV